MRALPPRVAWFHARALLLAWRVGDEFGWDAATRPADVATLLRLAAGHRSVAELGTATGWGAAAFVLADPERHVVSFDPVVQEHRERYLALLPAAARARLELVQSPGVDGARPVDFLFVDSTHSHEGTVKELTAWRAQLTTGAVVVLHDYDNPAFPGVASAVVELGLKGAPTGGSYVWRVP